MFGFGKQAQRARLDKGSPRDDAIDAARGALEDAASYLTDVLMGIGIDCAQLARREAVSGASIPAMFDRALEFVHGGQSMALEFAKTGDFESYDLEPHYRYLEIRLLLDELEDLRVRNDPLRATRIRQHAPHALIQASLLSYFLLRASTVERLHAAGDMNEIRRELHTNAQAIGGLTAQLPREFTESADIAAIRAEWNAWPHILVRPHTTR